MTDIFDDLVSGTPADADSEQTTEGAQTEAANATETAQENASEWPKTVTLPVGERPEGSVTIAEFAEAINKQVVEARVSELLGDGKSALEAAMEAMTAQVNPASFYQAVKAQRNPMPHYVVRYEVPVVDGEGNETGETKTDEKFFVPTDVATEWWKNRPTRGGGGASRSEEDVEKRLIRAGKKVNDLKAAEARLAKLTANVERMRGQVEKYNEWLTADGKTLDDAVAAYEASVESEEAEKAIGDNE